MSTMTAKEVKEIREALGLTGDALAELLGVSGVTVRRWECGLRKAKGTAANLLRKLAKEQKEKENHKEVAHA